MSQGILNRGCDMKCPHCLAHTPGAENTIDLGVDGTGHWQLVKIQCANSDCRKFIFMLREREGEYRQGMAKFVITDRINQRLVYPRSSSRSQVPPDVPNEYADDYKEACLVLADSPKASAALSRRCLQHILREVAKVKHGNLHDEIQEVIDSGSLPSHLAESIDAIRNIGNIAAHPIKNESTGEIVPVEEGEAEWNLDVLESLFDFYFVQPAIIKRKRDALNKKLEDAGKKPME